MDPDEREAVRDDAWLFARTLDPLDFPAPVEDLREDDREDFEDAAFFVDALFGALFFDAPRDAEDLRPVFFDRPELLDLLAAFPAAFFFLATGSPPLSGVAGARIIQFRFCRIETAAAS